MIMIRAGLLPLAAAWAPSADIVVRIQPRSRRGPPVASAMSPVSPGVAGWQAVADQFAARGDAELGEDLPQVIVHGARAQEQLRRDLLVGQPLGDQPRDLQFLWRQLLHR